MKRFAAESDDWKAEPSGDWIGPIRGLMNQYFAHLLGYRPKLSSFLALDGH
jgi:hypothetical protein